MALSASTIFEISSTATASNVNAGGFNPGNANMATDLTTDANTANTNSPVVSSASYNFVAGDVGHWVYIKSGTNWTPGWYQIASVASNKATLSAAVGQAIQVTQNVFGTNTAAGCATVGTPTGGVWTVDYSQSNASPFASTDLASTNGTTNPSAITSASNPFGVNKVGNLVHVTAGTNWTAGWYEIVSVSGSTATLDRAVGTSATLSSGTGKVGGALSLGSSDDAVFELATQSATTSSRFFIKGGSSVTYTIGGTVSVSAVGNNAWPVIYEGYAATRGDRPTGATRPTLACGGNSFTCGGGLIVYSLIFSGTGNGVAVFGNPTRVYFSKCVNSSTTGGRAAFNSGSDGHTYYACEAISYRGNAMNLSGQVIVRNCYVHDSDTGINLTSSSDAAAILNNIICNTVTNAINISTDILPLAIVGNTLYGAENKQGVGINIASGQSNATVENNIIYGFTTGISHGAVNIANYSDYNDFYNNTNDVNDVAKWQKGAHDAALDPQFSSVTQLTGATATTSGSVLTQSGADFSAVTDGQDFVHIKSGTGITAGIYGITSHTTTTLTLDIAPGTNATADKVWQVTLGRNFTIGTNLKALGAPGSWPANTTVGYVDIGAAQRQEPAGGGGTGGSYTFAG